MDEIRCCNLVVHTSVRSIVSRKCHSQKSYLTTLNIICLNMNIYNISEISSMVFKNYPRKMVVIISVAEIVQANCRSDV